MTNAFALWASGAPWTWFVLAIALLILELATGATYALWIAVAAAVTGLVLLAFDPGWQAQLGLFAVLTIAITAAGRRLLRPGWLKSDAPGLNEGAARVTGQIAVAAVDFRAGEGRARLGDTVWAARAADGAAVLAGDALDVTGLDGATLLVRPRG